MSKQKHGRRYNETEIVRILQEVSQGKALAEVARQKFRVAVEIEARASSSERPRRSTETG